jgi:stage III sporulation protein SpoIIIAA
MNKPKDYKEPKDKQKIFSELYTGKYFANGVDSYCEAYGIDLEKQPQRIGSVRASVTRLLKNANILAYIRELRGEYNLVEEIVNNEHAFLILQNAELGVKLGAIKHFRELNNKIENKIADNKVEIEIILPDDTTGKRTTSEGDNTEGTNTESKE